MTILRTSDVTSLTGLSRTTIWRLERQNAFPARIRLTGHSVGWKESEVQQWISLRPRGLAVNPASHTSQASPKRGHS